MKEFIRRRVTKVYLIIIAVGGALLFLNFSDYFTAPEEILDVASTSGQQLRVADSQPGIRTRDIKTISQGENAALVLTSKGDVYARGMNAYGELGLGNFGGEAASLEKITFPDNAEIVQLDISQSHAVALDDKGNVWTWGKNMSGQLGDGTWENRNKPIKVFEDAKEIAAGYRFSAAIKKNGELWAWGMNCDPATPGLDMLINAFASDLSVGGSYHDGSDANNTVECLNEQNLPIASKEPRKIETPVSLTHVSAGYGHILMIDDQQQAWGFGCNGWGQLGRGHNENDANTQRLAKSDFPDGTRITAISAGFRHSMAIDTEGKLWTWGHSEAGEVIKYGESKTEAPQRVELDQKVTSIDAGKDMSGITMNGSLYLAGDNQEGQLFPDIKAHEWAIKSFKKAADTATAFSLGEKQQYYWGR